MSLRPLHLITAASALLTSACIHSRCDPDHVAKDLLQTIRSQLPSGWTATYDPQCDWLQVTRHDDVSGYSTPPNSPAFPMPEPHSFWFAFRVRPAISNAEFRRLRSENADTDLVLRALYSDLARRGMGQKFDSFRPRTEDERAAVARYETLKASRHELPEFRFRHASLHFFPPQVHASEAPILAECEPTQNAVLNLLSCYSNDN